MTFTAALLSTILCAITWFEADGVTPKNQPEYVWPRERADKLVEIESQLFAKSSRKKKQRPPGRCFSVQTNARIVF